MIGRGKGRAEGAGRGGVGPGGGGWAGKRPKASEFLFAGTYEYLPGT